MTMNKLLIGSYNYPTLYALKSPCEKCYGVFDTRWDAWQFAFDLQDNEFRRKFWKRVQPSRRAMREKGWVVIKGTFCEK